MKERFHTIPIPLLLGLIDYDRNSGTMLWKERDPSAKKNRRWNASHAGKVVRGHKDISGHVIVSLNRRRLFAHRIIWALHYGVWPSDFIDHINGNPADNSVSNLRLADNATNQKNRKLNKNNSTGRAGVKEKNGKGRQVWHAVASFDGATKHLGTFGSFADACAAREAAEREIGGYTKRHGRPEGEI